MKPLAKAICADLHLGNRAHEGGATVGGVNDRGQISLDVLERAFATAQEHKAKQFVVCGDFFHYSKPEPGLITKTSKICEDSGFKPADIIIIPGNHDMPSYDASHYDTAVDPLYKVATIVNSPCNINGSSFIPFSATGKMSDYLKEEVKKLGFQSDYDNGGYSSTLYTHIGVYDDNSPPWCKDAKDGIHIDALFDLLDTYDYEFCFVGNFHEHKIWKNQISTVVQTGTLCPGGFGDAGIFPSVGGLVLFDNGNIKMLEIPGPRFVEQSGDESTGHKYFTRQVQIEEEAVVTPTSTKVVGLSPEEAIEFFIEKYINPAGITQEELKEAAREYWLKAAK